MKREFYRTLIAVAGVLSAILPAAGSEALEDPSDPIAGREHWAFRPLDPGAPPHVDAAFPSSWARNTIDLHVLKRLRENDLQPGPEAAPRDLIRRLYFQLLGMPPTPEQVEAFLTDSSSDALERLVDGLLNSPRYGERWGRHWLDLARYADSNGLDENFLFREAWRYRNWVIDAVNRDKSFDRFILEQIAGDLLPYSSTEERDRQRIAAGFLVMGPKVLLGNDAKNQRMEVADEQIDTIGRSLLGLTLGCARCHDHKFEPVPTADYYALAGIFTSTSVMEQRYMLGQQRVMEQLVGLGPEGDAKDRDYETYWRELSQKKSALQKAESALKDLRKKNDEAKSASHAEEIVSQEKKIAQLKGFISRPPKIPPRAMIPSDVEKPANEAIRLAGRFDKLGETVPRGFLRVVSDSETPTIPPKRSGREELGRWLTDTEHGAGKLAARVLANRVWHHLIGRGLVRTVDNFGRTGEPPSHPALLDHLASELINSGWSIKHLVRHIVLSRTFALSSAHQPEAHAIDPENRLLWRGHRRRLDPESLRDAMLTAANTLDTAWTDSTVFYLGDQATAVGKNENRRRTNFQCRSLYLPMIRNDLPGIFEVFNFADPHATTGARPKITSATQGLFMLNDTLVMDAATATAKRLEQCSTEHQDTTEIKISRLFQWILNAVPSSEDQLAYSDFFRTTKESLEGEGHKEPTRQAWTMVCHAMFSLTQFQFLD